MTSFSELGLAAPLLRALEEAGLGVGDVQPVYLPPADARAAFDRLLELALSRSTGLR